MLEDRGEVVKLHPALRLPAHEFYFFGGQVLGSPHGRGAALSPEPLVHDQALIAEVFGHGGARIRGWVLNVRPVDVMTGKFEVRFDRVTGIAPIAEEQSPTHKHLVAADVIDSSQGSVAGVLAVRALGVLGGGFQEFQIAFENVFDAEKDVAESGAPHERGESFAMVSDGGSHGLHKVINLVEAGGNDGLAQGLEAVDVQCNVVVDQKNGSGAVVAGVANVGQHAVERVSMKITAAHLDDGAETAIVGAAP